MWCASLTTANNNKSKSWKVNGKTKADKNTLTFSLHPQQLEVYHCLKRYIIVEAGRRWGKTELAWIKQLLFMLEHPGCLTWWVAPLYKELRPATRKIRNLTPKQIIEKTLEHNETLSYMRIKNGAECFLHSADKEDSLRGDAVHYMTIDEAPLLKKNRFDAELKPTLIDFNAPCVFIGTPKGKTWFSDLKQKGKDPANTEYKTFHFSSYGNAKENGGFIPKAYIDAVANDMPEMLRRQEIYAEELEGEGLVFRHIKDRVKPIAPYRAGERVVCASDIAKDVDYWCNIAIRFNGEVVALERQQKLDYPFMRQRTINFCRQHNNAPLLIDSTGVGDPTFDDLSREYPEGQVEGYKLTNLTKKQLIENLSIMLDNGEVWIPASSVDESKVHPDFEVLVSELEAYSYELTKSGLIRYNAPEGLHDDTVICLALAAWQIKTCSPLGGGSVSKFLGK